MKTTINIRKLTKNQQPPMELLLLADPLETSVYEYIHKGHCYIAEIEEVVVGIYVLQHI